MRLAERYDVICAGGGLSSFLCAALLSRAGKRVLVIEDSDRAVPRTYGDGYIFDPDFAGFSGLNASAALGKSLNELGIGDEIFFRSEPRLQVLTPDYRVVFSKDVSAMRRAVEREIADSGRQISDFFSLIGRAAEEIPQFVEGALTRGQGTASETTKWKRYWGPFYPFIQSERPVALGRVLPESAAAQCERLGGAILGATSYSVPVNLGCEQSLRGLSLAFRGQAYCVGGQETLKRRLSDIIVAAGGGVKRDTRVESLITESKRVVGVLLSSFEGIIRGDTVVISSRLRRLYQTLPENMRDVTLTRSLNRVTPASWRFTLSLTVNREVVPMGSTDVMTYIGSHQHPLEEENYLRIQIVPEALGPGKARADTTTILATALVPYRASSLDYSYLRRLGGKMLRVLAELMPFLEYNLVGLYPDFRNSDKELREAYPFDGPDWIPENLMQYYIRGHRSVQDFWGPSWTTPHRSLYFAGRSVWPSLGVYGEALTARKIFDDVMLPRN